MAITLNGTTGITTPAVTNDGAYTGDGITFADGTPSNTLVTNTSGNIGIGTSSPVGKLEVVGTAYISSASSNQQQLALYANSTASYVTSTYQGSGSYKPLAFEVAGSERMRIDSSGNLLVGTTNTSQANGIGVKLINTGVVYSVAATGPDGFSFYNTTAGAYRFYVNTNGVINATSTSITAISDIRLKENVRPLDLGLAEVIALQPRRYDWKEGKGQDKKDAVGFIAQEFETIFPNSVGTSKAGEDGIEYKNINYEELVPTLVKAIQEQQAIITDLKSRIEALEQA